MNGGEVGKKMPYFVVIEEQGPHWDDECSMRDQKGWDEHAVFMDALAEEHFVILGGPLGNYAKHRAMLILNAPNEVVLRKKIAEDPWMRTGVLPDYRDLFLAASPWKTNLRAGR